MTHVPALQTIRLSLAEGIARIELNRPDKANAINLAMWQELRAAMRWLQDTPEARVAILSAAGAHFSAGLDLATFDQIQQATRDDCDGRAREKLLATILDLQDTVTAIERCPKPVIASVHAACVGGGIDIITACDLRYCSAQAWFCVKEIDVGIVADVGTLQRLPLLIGEGMARELCYSGRRVEGAEAQAIRLVNRCYEDAAALRQGVEEMARCLAAKSPLALRGTKQAITHAREHSIADGLRQVALWNAAMLFSNDLHEVAQARHEGRAPRFAD